jgi:hypothetical protein
MRRSLRALAGALTCLTMLSAAALADDTQPPPGGSQTTVPATTPPPATPPSDNAAQTPPAQEGDDKIVCRKEPPPVGSRLGARKVCRTVADWRRQEAIAKETTDEIQSRKVPESAN